MALYNLPVAHVIEPASSSRAKCRSCNQPIGKGELRFGERQPNSFGEGEMTLWFHLRCGAYSRPEAFLAVASTTPPDASLEPLCAAARFGIEHRRVPRIHGAERASSGRAHCRACRELIAKNEWRIALVFFEEYRFDPGGYLHVACARDYFETTDVLERIRHFSPELGEADFTELAAALALQE
jgi:Poly(ADP-ribose) polymerase and DNA-Ligase Zn-finger region